IVLLAAVFGAFKATAQVVPDYYSTAPSGTPTLISLPDAYNDSPNTAPANFNYARTFVPRIPMTDTTGWRLAVSTSVGVATTYVSGNGSTLMTIARKSNQNHDIVVANDNRQQLTTAGFLSYPVSTSNFSGSAFRMDPFGEQRSYYQSL